MYPSAEKYYLKDDYLVVLVKKGASYSPVTTATLSVCNLTDTISFLLGHTVALNI